MPDEGAEVAPPHPSLADELIVDDIEGVLSDPITWWTALPWMSTVGMCT